jgi:hypothetical protein
MTRGRAVAYWALMAIVSFEMVAGSIWDLERIEYVRVVLTHLGYPLYLLLILGVWKLPCAAVLLLPRLPRLKEWAYAGAFFNYSGAVASHALVGDSHSIWQWPLIFAISTLMSWALRPPERRLEPTSARVKTRPIEWIVPIIVMVVMLIVSLITIPQAPPRF